MSAYSSSSDIDSDQEFLDELNSVEGVSSHVTNPTTSLTTAHTDAFNSVVIKELSQQRADKVELQGNNDDLRELVLQHQIESAEAQIKLAVQMKQLDVAETRLQEAKAEAITLHVESMHMRDEMDVLQTRLVSLHATELKCTELATLVAVANEASHVAVAKTSATQSLLDASNRNVISLTSRILAADSVTVRTRRDAEEAHNHASTQEDINHEQQIVISRAVTNATNQRDTIIALETRLLELQLSTSGSFDLDTTPINSATITSATTSDTTTSPTTTSPTTSPTTTSYTTTFSNLIQNPARNELIAKALIITNERRAKAVVAYNQFVIAFASRKASLPTWLATQKEFEGPHFNATRLEHAEGVLERITDIIQNDKWRAMEAMTDVVHKTKKKAEKSSRKRKYQESMEHKQYEIDFIASNAKRIQKETEKAVGKLAKIEHDIAKQDYNKGKMIQEEFRSNEAHAGIDGEPQQPKKEKWKHYKHDEQDYIACQHAYQRFFLEAKSCGYETPLTQKSFWREVGSFENKKLYKTIQRSEKSLDKTDQSQYHIRTVLDFVPPHTFPPAYMESLKRYRARNRLNQCFATYTKTEQTIESSYATMNDPISYTWRSFGEAFPRTCAWFDYKINKPIRKAIQRAEKMTGAEITQELCDTTINEPNRTEKVKNAYTDHYNNASLTWPKRPIIPSRSRRLLSNLLQADSMDDMYRVYITAYTAMLHHEKRHNRIPSQSLDENDYNTRPIVDVIVELISLQDDAEISDDSSSDDDYVESTHDQYNKHSDEIEQNDIDKTSDMFVTFEAMYHNRSLTESPEYTTLYISKLHMNELVESAITQDVTEEASVEPTTIIVGSRMKLHYKTSSK